MSPYGMHVFYCKRSTPEPKPGPGPSWSQAQAGPRPGSHTSPHKWLALRATCCTRLRQHVFSDRVASKRVAASAGWVRCEETRIQAHRREWKHGQRDVKPEEDPFSLDKLQKRMRAQLHAGSVPASTCRRPSVATQGRKLLKSKTKLKEKPKRASAACKALREMAA